MNVWHRTSDAPRHPDCVGPGRAVQVTVGTWPIEPGQRVWITFAVESGSGAVPGFAEAQWKRNSGPNSYWTAEFGPFVVGDRVRYVVHAVSSTGEREAGPYTFRVAPSTYLAILWHQHQPLYRVDQEKPDGRGGLTQPWVRLHALRDYYSMAALVAEHPSIRLTFNLTPVLLSQIDDYVEGGLTDRHLDLTKKAAGRLTQPERDEILGTFFDADWHHQIFMHPRYRALFDRRVRGEAFATSDFRDLQMWSNLAWFNAEFRNRPVALVTGETVDVHRFVRKAEGFSARDLRAMLDEQYKVLRAIVPIHRLLQDRGQIEVTTTPFYHPILPLLIDTDQATIDRRGATHPSRFSHPEDADAQVHRAVRDYEHRFGRAPRGMWPAEGAVSRASVRVFARQGVRWIASDRGVLARSGRWGYDVSDPDVLCRPYDAREGEHALAIFFRDTALSDAIGFHLQQIPDPEQAAERFVSEVAERFGHRSRDDQDRVVAVILDGENAWGAYDEDGRPFLQALYSRLSATSDIQTVTFSEYLEGSRGRAVSMHEPITEVHELFTGSWIDEAGSEPGVDLGTWIGESQENRAWDLLATARMAAGGAERGKAMESVYAAEGSDWFWWFGDDQNADRDERFDELFRAHLRMAYREVGIMPPPELEVPLVTPRVVWTFANQVSSVAPGEWLVVQTNCPGVLTWRATDGSGATLDLRPMGGVLAGARRFEGSIGLVFPTYELIRFSFRCSNRGRPHDDACCRGEDKLVRIRAHA